MGEKFYINVVPPFSWNSYLGGGSDERAPGQFITLKNYIPDGDILRAREGITIFSHTPDVTVIQTNDFSGDANALSWYKMSYFTGNSLIDEISGNHVSAVSTSNVSRDTTNVAAPGLSASISFDNSGAPGSNAYFKLNFANFAQKLPGHVGENTTISVCFWVRITSFANGSMGFAAQWHADSGARSWMFYTHSANSNFRWILQHTAASSLSVTSDQTMSTDTWYHCLSTYNSADKSMTMRVLDTAGNSHYSGSTTLPNDIDPFDQGLSVGGFNNADTAAITGQMQELVIFNDVVSKAEQDQIRTGTYTP